MPWVDAICPITGQQAQVNSETFGDVREYRCPQCGDFKITISALATFEALSFDEKLERFVYAKALAGADNPVTVTA